MDPMSRGLRFRLRRAARQTVEQHEHIDQILGDLRGALDGRDRERVADVFASYRAAVRAHFTLEEDVFFPALHGLHPEHRVALEALIQDHGEMRTDLETLAGSLDGAALGPFAARLRDLVERMREHEGREERLVRSVVPLREGDGEGSSPPGSGPSTPSGGR
jgi:hypothetical protein